MVIFFKKSKVIQRTITCFSLTTTEAFRATHNSYTSTQETCTLGGLRTLWHSIENFGKKTPYMSDTRIKWEINILSRINNWSQWHRNVNVAQLFTAVQRLTVNVMQECWATSFNLDEVSLSTVWYLVCYTIQLFIFLKSSASYSCSVA